MTSWNPTEDATAVSLWNVGQSATEIAKVLTGRSRNMVIGRLSRLGCKRDRPALSQVLSRLTGRPKTAINIPKPPKAKKPRPPATVIVMESPSHLNIKLTDLGARSCRWPTIHDGESFRFCGLTTEPGATYCPACMERFRPFHPSTHRLRAA